MKDETKTKEEFIRELQQLRRQVAKFDKSEQEREKAKEELRESEARLKELAELLPEIVCETDEKGNLTYVNRIAYEKFGYTEEDFNQGMNVLQVIIPGDRDRVRANMGRITAGEKLGEIEYTVLRKDGSTFPVSIYSNAIIRQKKPVGFRTIVIDNTWGKKVADELKRSEERYRAIFENTGTAIAVTEEDTMISLANHEMELLSGYSKEELEGKRSWTDFVVREDLARMKKYHGLRRDNPVSAPRNYEFKLVDKQANIKNILITISMIPETKKAIASFLDITEQKKAEEELKLRAEMLDQASDGIMLRDFDGNLLYANETAIKDRGYTLEEFFKLNARDLIVAEPNSESIKEWDQRLMEKGYSHTEFGIRHKDGSLVPMDAMATKIKSGNKEYILSITRNITEQKKTEEALKESDERLRLFMNSATDAFSIWDSELNLVDCNEVRMKLFFPGLRKEEVIGKNIVELYPFFKGTDRHSKYLEVLKTGKPLFIADTVRIGDISLPESEQRHHSIRAFKVGNGLGLINTDITERVRAEAERAVLERKSQVTNRMAVVGEMASGIAHEINNPLTGVVGFAQLLADRKDLPEDVREQLKIIHEGGHRVANIIKGLLSFARQSKPKREYVDINEIVEETLQLSHYKLETSNIEIIKRFEPELPWTMVDAGQLQQVFINLILNAEQEMSSAHGKGKLEIKTELAGDRIRISFKDDGPGIAKETIKRIFNPFFTTKEVGKGTGLGLSLSHGIIAEHGGQLYIESELRKGATFVVELPLLTKEEEIEKVEAEAGTEEKGRILVVDDEEVVRQYLNSVLTKMGHTVEMATNGEEALELVKSTRYNLILSDIKMPGMDGKEFYKNIEEIAPSLTRRVVFITGDVMGEDTQDFLLETGAQHITKPFDAGNLRRVVNDMLSGSKK
ncbi:MAG: PAS domain S-box protein [Dehalococcoidia bacterium]|nr:PAS domain S-box protein [Dehalococcoidia bacterium]